MKKTVLSCVAVLGLCVALPAVADVDETFMDWSYASGLEPKQRPQETQATVTNGGLNEIQNEEFTADIAGFDGYDGDIYATSEMGTMTSNQNQTTSGYANSSYTVTQTTSAQGMNAGYNQGIVGGTNMAVAKANTSATGYTVNAQNGQVTATPQYYQVPITAIQTPAEIHHVNNPIKVQYPVTKQYPISMQYPVTVQKEITVQRPVVVQQPIVVQRPIVMQQPVMVQHQPLMVQNKPVMVQQQPTVVQKQPIVVNAPAPNVVSSMGYQMPTVPMTPITTTQPTCAHMQNIGTLGATETQTYPVHTPVKVTGTFMGMAIPSSGCVGCRY